MRVLCTRTWSCKYYHSDRHFTNSAHVTEQTCAETFAGTWPSAFSSPWTRTSLSRHQHAVRVSSGASPLSLCSESSIVYVQLPCLLAISPNCLQCSNFYTLFKGSLCVLIAEGNISGISNHGNESFSSQNWCQLHWWLDSSTPGFC